MNMLEEHRKKRRATAIAFVLMIVTGAIGLMDWFMLRDAVNLVVRVSGVSPWSWNLIDVSAMLILGLAWLCLILFYQHKYAVALTKNKIRQPFFKVTGVQLLILFVCKSIPLLLGTGEMTGSYLTVYVPTAVIGVLLIVLSYRAANSSEQRA